MGHGVELQSLREQPPQVGDGLGLVAPALLEVEQPPALALDAPRLGEIADYRDDAVDLPVGVVGA